MLGSFLLYLSLASLVPPETAPAPRAIEVNLFAAVITSARKNVQDFDSPNAYPTVRFKNRITGTVRTVEELTAVERDVFYIMQAEVLSRQLAATYNVWLAKSKAVGGGEELYRSVLTVRPFPDEQELPSTGVKKYLQELWVLRQKLATKHEKMVAKLYQAHPHRFTHEEGFHHLRTLKEAHNQEKLLERTKP